jgi:uncharacterized protein YndB with AHSA1/START domain
MQTFLRILLGIVLVVVLAVAGCYLDGKTLPVNHSTTVTRTVDAPPDLVFARITNVAAGASWRPEVKAVTLLPPDNGRDHWVEDLGHGQTMNFLAVKTEAPTERDVLLDVPGASYGGTWTYRLAPGPTPGTTTLSITEAGFINPPFYRFMMHHVFGMDHNINAYFKDLDNSFKA